MPPIALALRRRKEVCPYCFEPFRLRETPFRCTSPAALCVPVQDEIRARVWQDSAPLGRVLPVAGAFARQSRCPACGHASRRRLCPHCHMELPQTTGRFRNLIFAVIGAKEAGKSHYLAILIEQIRQVVGPALGVLLEPLNDQTIRRYREDFFEPIFRRGTVIRGTVSALVDRQVQMPLVYTLTLEGKDLFGRRRIRGVVTLVFFDTAGEDLDDEDTMSTVNKYIYRSDGIILLLDPLQLPRVRDRLAATTPLPARIGEVADILSRTTRLILAGRELPHDAMIATPLAVAFSKFDAVEPLVDPQLQLNAGADHHRGFDTADFQAVDAEMQALLVEWEGEVIPQQVRARYRCFGFFGLTALGCNPHRDQRIPRVLPRRVEDPFLWLLHHHRLIPARPNREARGRR
jgi:hypothetical protein